MKYDNLNQEEMIVEQVVPHNEVVRKGIKHKTEKKNVVKSKSAHETVDFVILQTGIACGILLLILAVNVLTNGIEPLKSVFTSMTNLLSNII